VAGQWYDRGQGVKIWKLAGVSGLVVAASAAADEPLYVKNLSPVTGLLGLPAQRDAAPVNGWGVDLHTSIASHYVFDLSDEEALLLDGETLRFALDMRYALGERWELQLEVPWLQHSGGNLDSLINGWHDLWGMSDGGRSNAEDDVLDYRYQSQDANFSLQDDASGLGDVSASVSYAFFRDDNAAAALTAGYKLGSGEEDDFLGSGGDDVWIAVRFSGDHLSDLPLSWHGQLGYLYADDSELLGSEQNNNLWFAGLALDWRVTERWSLLAQLDANAAPLDSDIDALGTEAILLSFGARWRFSPGWALDLNFVEDAQVETGPDVTFQASVRYRPRR